MQENGQKGGCPFKFFKMMKHGGKGGKGRCGKWQKWKSENPNFDWKEMTPEKKFWFKMMKNKRMFFKMMRNEEFFNKMMKKFEIDPKSSPELMKVLEQKKQFWMNFQKGEEDFDWKNMCDKKKFWCKVMMRKGMFWKMMKNMKFFNKQMEKHNIDPKDAPELMQLFQQKKQEQKELKG